MRHNSQRGQEKQWIGTSPETITADSPSLDANAPWIYKTYYKDIFNFNLTIYLTFDDTLNTVISLYICNRLDAMLHTLDLATSLYYTLLDRALKKKKHIKQYNN